MTPTAGSERPVGFLSVRLDHMAGGVRATVCWNADVEFRHDDRRMETRDMDLVLARVHKFVREFIALGS